MNQPFTQINEYMVQAGSTSLCVRDYGEANRPTVLLVMGLACQMTFWPPALIEGFLQRSFRVICFDNRDIGLSQKFPSDIHYPILGAFAKAQLGLKPRAGYTLLDMAKDTVNLIHALGLERVHLMGVSMGGMISQLVAAYAPHQVQSLNLVMTSTNRPWLPLPKLAVIRELIRPLASTASQEEVVAASLRFWHTIQSPYFPTPDAELGALLAANYTRNYDPSGVMRQMQAIVATGDLRPALHRIQAPTQVIHGSADTLIAESAGRELARHISGARYQVIDGLGHDLPEKVLATLVELTAANAARAGTR